MINGFLVKQLYSRLLNINLYLTGLYALIQSFEKEQTSEALREMASDIQSLEKNMEQLKEQIMELAESSVEDNLEVDGISQDGGMII